MEDPALMTIMEQMLHQQAQQRPTASELLQRPQLLSDEQKALMVERTKVKEANMALQQLHPHQITTTTTAATAPTNLFLFLPLPMRRGLQRSNTWNGHSLLH